MSQLIDPSDLPALRRQTRLLQILLLDRNRSDAGVSHHLTWQSDGSWHELQLSDLAKFSLDYQPQAELQTPREIVAKVNRQVDYRSGHWPADSQNWQTYVTDLKLELCCGVAPFIVDRSSVTQVSERVGFLDRKLQTVSRFCRQPTDWLHWAQNAYQSSYGYELYGDRLFLAREKLLYTFVDFWNQQFPDNSIDLRRKLAPAHQTMLEDIAEIISWNLFQMDGLTYQTPGTDIDAKIMDWSVQKTVKLRCLAK